MQIDKTEIENMINFKIDNAQKKFGVEFKFTLIEILSLEKMLAPKAETEEKNRLIPLTKWNDYHPDPSVCALRMLAFNKDRNGFDKVIERRGHRVLINEQAYFEWQEQNKKISNVG
jgi:hypothetical protein